MSYGDKCKTKGCPNKACSDVSPFCSCCIIAGKKSKHLSTLSNQEKSCSQNS